MNQTINLLNNRKLEECYFSIICIPTKLYFCENEDYINETEFYVLYGCNMQGVRKFITVVNTKYYNKTSDWYGLLTKLQQRGVKIVLYALTPDNKYLEAALKLAFNGIDTFYTCYTAINKLSKYYTDSYNAPYLSIIRDIYLSSNINEYNLYLEKFNEEYKTTQFILELLTKDFELAKTYYKHPKIIRKSVFSFYFYRDISKKLSSLKRVKPYIKNTDEIVEFLIPTIKSNEKYMFCSKSEWIEIINYLYTHKKELIKSYL